jgi:hypothetical protein
MKNKLIQSICGLREDAGSLVVPPVPADDVEQPVRQSRATYDEEAGLEGEADPGQQVVASLVQAWKSGQQNDVASQILFTPVSYADFVKLCAAIGPNDAIQLGLMLDELADSQGLEGAEGETPDSRILSRVRQLDAGPPEGGEALPPEDEQMPEEQSMQPPPKR